MLACCNHITLTLAASIQRPRCYAAYAVVLPHHWYGEIKHRGLGVHVASSLCVVNKVRNHLANQYSLVEQSLGRSRMENSRRNFISTPSLCGAS